MKMALNAKRNFGFVDGSIACPSEDADPVLISSW